MKYLTPDTTLGTVLMGGCSTALLMRDTATLQLAILGLLNCPHLHSYMVNSEHKIIYCSESATDCMRKYLDTVEGPSGKD